MEYNEIMNSFDDANQDIEGGIKFLGVGNSPPSKTAAE